MDPRYLVERTAQAMLTVFAVVTLSFILIRMMPGGPISYLRAQLYERAQSSGKEVEKLVDEYADDYLNLNPNEPLWNQYVEYITSVFQGDLGTSIWGDELVTTIVADALPWTLFIMFTATLVIVWSGILFGALMAFYEGSWFDSGMTVAKTVLSSIPYYVFAIFLIALFAYNMELLPSGGRIGNNVTPGLNAEFMASAWLHALLPIASMVIAGFGGPALQMRGNSIQVLGSEYLRVGRLRGLSSGRLATMYVGRNAVLPLYTGFLIQIASLFGGAVVLETIFGYKGMGLVLIRAFEARNYPVLMGGFIVITVATVIGVFVADITYGLVDPRIQSGERHEQY